MSASRNCSRVGSIGSLARRDCAARALHAQALADARGNAHADVPVDEHDALLADLQRHRQRHALPTQDLHRLDSGDRPLRPGQQPQQRQDASWASWGITSPWALAEKGHQAPGASAPVR